MKTAIFGVTLAVAIITCSTGTASAEVFEGVYLGTQLGWNHDEVGRVGVDLGTADVRKGNHRVSGGVFAGYNRKLSAKILVGTEAGFTMAVDDENHRGISKVDPEYSFDLSLRSGYFIKTNTMVYVRGGYENTRALIYGAGPAQQFKDRDNFGGWSAGSGVEHVIRRDMSVRLEYRYSDLGAKDRSFDRQKVMLGISYHF